MGNINITKAERTRSEHIRKIVQGGPTVGGSVGGCIPRTIVQFWDKAGGVPDDVRECIDSWELLSGGFERLLFDSVGARDFISDRFSSSHVRAFDLCHHPAMKCDYFRLCYILDRGGFYVDADEVYLGGSLENLFSNDSLKVQPLCYDTSTGEMVGEDVFVDGKKYSKDWIFYVNNNPIISPPNHPVVRLALDRSTRILLGSEGRLTEIQDTTGPINFSVSLVRHHLEMRRDNVGRDFSILSDWGNISISKWPLGYRSDERNWRTWNQKYWAMNGQESPTCRPEISKERTI